MAEVTSGTIFMKKMTVKATKKARWLRVVCIMENSSIYNQKGEMAHGVYTVGDKTYGFNKWTGVLLNGEHYFTDGRSDQWYYFYEKDDEHGHKKGEMATGWQKHSGNDYYYNEKGEMAHGVYEINGVSYGFDEWTGLSYPVNAI